MVCKRPREPARRLVAVRAPAYSGAAMPRVFIAQTAVDRWLSTQSLLMEGDMARIASLPQTSMYINPAVHFHAVDGGGADPYDILGAVKTSQELAQMGADHYETSVVLGDYAYTVLPWVRGHASVAKTGPRNCRSNGQSPGAVSSPAMEQLGAPM